MLQSCSGEDHLLPNIIIALVLELEKGTKKMLNFLPSCVRSIMYLGVLLGKFKRNELKFFLYTQNLKVRLLEIQILIETFGFR